MPSFSPGSKSRPHSHHRNITQGSKKASLVLTANNPDREALDRNFYKNNLKSIMLEREQQPKTTLRLIILKKFSKNKPEFNLRETDFAFQGSADSHVQYRCGFNVFQHVTFGFVIFILLE